MIKSILRKAGILSSGNESRAYPEDVSPADIGLIESVANYTMTSFDRRLSLINAIDYILENKINGDIVECGVWKGGSMLLAAKRMFQNNCLDKKFYLYDTYNGMSEPTANDIQYDGKDANELLKLNKKDENNMMWCYAPIEHVKNLMKESNYPFDKFLFVKGKVEDTIPQTIPDKISLLRLDTDFYESTKHELEHLFPLLSPGGILIIDDYGHWQGARKAVDNYFSMNNIPIYMSRVDYTGRIAVKQAQM